MNAVKERFAFGNASPRVQEIYLQTVQEMNSEEQRFRSLTPPCPDGSGEIGYYDHEASEFLGDIFSTIGENKKYFTWNESRKTGHMLKDSYVEALKKFLGKT